MKSLAWPARLDPATGRFVTVAGDRAVAQQVGVLVGTVQGDRALFQGFGLPDPSGIGVDPAEVSALAAFWVRGGTVVEALVDEGGSPDRVRLRVTVQEDGESV